MWRVIYFMRYAWFVNYLCLVVKISFPWGFSDNDWFKTWRVNFVNICVWNGITFPPLPPSYNYDYHHHYYFMRLTLYSRLFCRVVVSWVSPTHLNPPSLCARRLSRSIKIFVCLFSFITLATLANFVCNRKFTTNSITKLFRRDL